jgi:glucose-6-phosphate 1-dehydrogenase
MEPPASLNSEAIRDEKVKVLRSIPTPETKCQQCVRGQYEGYRGTERVAPKSNTETYIAIKLIVDNWRWAGVPFYLRTGKSLAARSSEIVVTFKQPPMTLFSSDCETFSQNLIHVRLQPNEGVHLCFNAKQPGKTNVKAVEMDFAYHAKFGSYTPEAYERLLYDVIVGDSTLFTRADEVLEAWRIVDGIRASWGQEDLPLYRRGSWGPREADDLLKKDGNFWATLASEQ